MKVENQDIIDNLITSWKQERSDLDASAMGIVGRVLILSKILEKRVGSVLKKSNIHYTDLDVLATLRRSGKPFLLTPTQLIQSVLITSGAMTALLDRLTKLDLIKRMLDPKDGRVKTASLTQKGKTVIDHAIKFRFNEADESINMFSKTEKETLSALLKKMLLHLDNK